MVNYPLCSAYIATYGQCCHALVFDMEYLPRFESIANLVMIRRLRTGSGFARAAEVRLGIQFATGQKQEYNRYLDGVNLEERSVRWNRSDIFAVDNVYVICWSACRIDLWTTTRENYALISPKSVLASSTTGCHHGIELLILLI